MVKRDKITQTSYSPRVLEDKITQTSYSPRVLEDGLEGGANQRSAKTNKIMKIHTIVFLSKDNCIPLRRGL